MQNVLRMGSADVEVIRLDNVATKQVVHYRERVIAGTPNEMLYLVGSS